MKERFDQMVEFTGCNPNLLMLLFQTSAYGEITKNQFKELLGGALEMIAYSQQIGSETKQFILAVGRHGSFPKYNLQDELHEYVKFEYSETQ